MVTESLQNIWNGVKGENMKKHLLVSAIFIFLFSSAGFAENFTIGGGPLGNIFIVDARPELDPGVGGQLFFDYRWSPQISTQFSIIVTTEDGKGANSGDNGIEFLGIPTIDLKYYLLSSESHFDPYLMAGIGLYAVSEGTAGNGTFAIGAGANVGFGLDYYLTEKWSLGLAASFRSIGLVDSTSGNNNGTALFPFSLAGNVGFHF